MPTLRLTAGQPSTRTAPKRKPAPAAKAPARKAPARKAKPAAAPQDNGAATRGPKLPDGWTKRDFDKLIKDMNKSLANKADAQEALDEAAKAVNVLALEAINEGIQMSVVSDTLHLSRQWLYNIMDKAEDYGFDGPVVTERQATKAHPNKGLTQEQIDAKKAAKAKAKPKAAPKRTAKPTAKRSPARKPAATTRKPPARKAPARRSPARGPLRIAA